MVLGRWETLSFSSSSDVPGVDGPTLTPTLQARKTFTVHPVKIVPVFTAIERWNAGATCYLIHVCGHPRCRRYRAI